MPPVALPPADEPDTTALAAIRGQISRMREGLDGIESALQRLERQQRTSERERPTRFYEVLVGVDEHGVHGIDDDSLNELAGAHGYQRRGAQGGSPEPERRGLPEWGARASVRAVCRTVQSPFANYSIQESYSCRS